MSQNHPVEEFQFPMQILKYRTIKSWKHFNELIKQENQHLRRDVSFQYITQSSGSQTLSIHCKQCQAFFRYINTKGDYFTLKDCNQMHRHILKQTHNFHQNIIEKIQKFLQQDDGKQQKHELESQICINYRITSRQFEQLYSQAAERLKRNTLLYDGKQIDELVKKMKSQRFIVQCDYLTSKIDREIKTITKSVFLLNDLMQLNYKKYGECCFVVVDERRPMNRWHLGGIMGIGKQLQLSLFAIFLLKSPDTDHLKGLLKIFFQKCESKPLTIITQPQFFYQQAIIQLKAQNLIQSQHIYDYYSQSQRLHKHNPKLKRIFIELSRQPQKNKFFKRLEEIYNEDNFNEYDFDLEELAGQADRVCMSQIPPVPVGPYRSAKNLKSQKKYDYSIIRAFYKIYQDKEHTVGKNLTNKVMNIIKALLQPIEEQNAENSRIMEIYPKLKQVRTTLAKNVMDYLMNKVYASIQFRLIKIDDQTYHVCQGRQNYFRVSKCNQRWACQCEESAKTMLPCVHEMTVCCKTDEPLTAQLQKRWTNEDQRLQQQMKRKTFKKPRNKRVTLSQFLA